MSTTTAVTLSRDELLANVHAVFTEVDNICDRLREFHADYVNAETPTRQGVAAGDAAGTIRMLASLTPMLDALYEARDAEVTA